MASRAMLGLVGDAAGRRGAERVRLLLSARLVTTSDEYAVTLRDISMTGAMVEAPRLPACGIDVLLKRGDFEVLSTMIWVEDRRAGLEFETPLAIEDFAAKFARTTWAGQAPAAMPRPMRLPPVTDLDWVAARACADPIGRDRHRA